MKHCFIIAAHKDCQQLLKLIKLLSYADIYIHIDAKSKDLYKNLNKEIKNIKLQNRKIVLLKNRISVNWSGFSQVNATLLLMREVVNSNIQYDYIHFISGQDLPIKKQNEIENIILSYKKRIQEPQFINCDEISFLKWRLKIFNFFRENKRNRKLYMRILDKMIRIIQIKILKVNRKNLNKFDLYVGSSWFSLTLPCIKYILKFIDQNKRFLNEFKYTSCPDEHFFQIILMNSVYRNNVVNNNLRFIDFPCGSNSPRYLKVSDLVNIKDKQFIIARKFDRNINLDAIEYVTNYLNN